MRFRFIPVSAPTQKFGLHLGLLALLVILLGIAAADVPRYNVQFLWEPYLAGSQSELGVAEADELAHPKDKFERW
jgi:hypothetical protein